MKEIDFRYPIQSWNIILWDIKKATMIMFQWRLVHTYIQLHHREMSLAQIYYSDWLILFCCINDNLVAKYAYKYIRKGECTPSNSKSLTISTKSYRYHAILILSRFENISKGLAILGRNTPPPPIPNTQYFEAGWGTCLYF